MYKINHINELTIISPDVDMCSVDPDLLLKFIYTNRNSLNDKFNIDYMRIILIKHIHNSYSKNINEDIILTKEDLDRILKII